jgi:hypothetical protein
MTFTPPNKILISSDDSLIELVKTEIKNKEKVYVYKFVRSLSNENFTKKDLIFSMSELEINKQLKNFFKIV